MHDEIVLALALSTTLFLQILSNLANDYGDRHSGADQDRSDRGAISGREMKRGIYICGALAFISGVALVFYGTRQMEWYYLAGFIALGLLALWAAIKYTVGKNAYGYYGLGDLFVFLFFGLTGVMGTFFLHTGFLTWGLVLPATSIGLLSVAVLNLNNMRDRVSDESVGKRTLAVLLGRSGSRVYHFILLIGAHVSAVVFSLIYWESPFQLIFLIILPIHLLNLKKVATYSDPQSLDPELKKIALSTLLFSITFGLGFIL